MRGPVLDVRDVTVVRTGDRLLDGVSWTVARGQRWVVLGPNGSGKTTLLRLATGDLYPTAGTVTILGERLGRVELARLRPRIGFESVALDPLLQLHLPVIDLVVSARHGATRRFRRHRYTAADERRARDLLDRLGCGALADRPASSLSQGEWQRARIARALVTDPELLLLDEPAAGLDLAGRELLTGALGDLAADDALPAIVLVTHHLEEIPPHFTHGLLLRDGAPVAAGPLADTLTADVLERTFGVRVEVQRAGGRWAARMPGPRSSRPGASGQTGNP